MILEQLKQLLLEIKKQVLIGATDQGRQFRSKFQVRTLPPKVIGFDNGDEFIDGNVKSYPSSEQKRHYCYFIYQPKTRDIKELWCDCKDFQYRLMVPMERNKLANRDNVPAKMNKNANFLANREWTKVTNPSGKLFFCKHLLALSRYIN